MGCDFPPAPDLLRRIVAANRAGLPLHPADIAELARASEAHLADPPGVRFDVALGLHPKWGARAWWTIEAQASRNSAVATLDRELYPDLPVSVAARKIAQLSASRQRRSVNAFNPTERAMLALIDRTGCGMPGERQIRDILATARGGKR